MTDIAATVGGMDRAPLDVTVLRSAAGAGWARLEVVAETGSTNADLLAADDTPDRAVLVAEHQVAGRGRLDRGWESPPRAGLTFSVLLRPTVPAPTWGWLPLLAGVALCEAVEAVSGLAVVLKWPNDLLFAPDGRKVAGILAQSGGGAVALGMGVNVSTTADELAVPTATSLSLCGADVDRTELLVAVLRLLDERLRDFAAARGDAVRSGLHAAFAAHCATIGQQVAVVVTDGRAMSGVALAVEPDGRLRIRTADREELVGAGDVEHLRPQ